MIGTLLPVAAYAQQAQPGWQELALRTQQNATMQQVIDNSIIAALQTEIVQLRAQLSKSSDPPDPKNEPPK